MKVFWKQGFDATSMKDLEIATQLTPGSIYHEFGNKAGMFEHALNHYVDTVMVSRVQRYLGQNGDPIQAVRDFVVSAFKGLPTDFKGSSCLLVNTASELGETLPPVSAIVKRGANIVARGLKDELLRAQSMQKIRADIDCVAAAKQLSVLMSGLLVASKTNHDVNQLASTVDFTLSMYR